MANAIIAVTTANRPEILNRCITSAAAGSPVARDARWIVVDDSVPEHREKNREITLYWKGRGLNVIHMDETLVQQITASLPPLSRDLFLFLIDRPSAYRIPGSRNLALLTGLSLEPELLFFMDDDIVADHERSNFFDWCASNRDEANYVATPRKRGIGDLHYPTRLLRILQHEDWRLFISESGISAAPELWHSPINPLWKKEPNEKVHRVESLVETEIEATRNKRFVSTQLLAIGNHGGEWLPFPRGHNEDFHWSLFQSVIHGTRLLSSRETSVKHLPPSIDHLTAEAIVSSVVSCAKTRAFERAAIARGGLADASIAESFGEIHELDIREEIFTVLAVESLLRQKASTEDLDINMLGTLSQIGNTLTDAKNRLHALNLPDLVSEWLADFEKRRRMFSALRQDEDVRKQISRVLLQHTAHADVAITL